MATNVGRVGIVMKGAWSNSAEYEALDAVTYNGALFIAKQAVPANTTPVDGVYWQLALDAMPLIQTYCPIHMLAIYEGFATALTFYKPIWVRIESGERIVDELTVNNGMSTFIYSYAFVWNGDGTVTKGFETLNGNGSDYLQATVVW